MAGGVNCRTGNGYFLAVLGSVNDERGGVNGFGDAGLFAIDGGLNSRAVLVFNAVKNRCVGLGLPVNVKGRLGVR